MKKKSLSAKQINRKKIFLSLSDTRIKKNYNDFCNFLKIKKNFAVAVSGGPDSLALSYLAFCYSIKMKLKCYFYVVDHKFRTGSSREADIVKSKLKKSGFNCKILRLKKTKYRSNIQSDLRNARYKILINECQKKGIKYLLLGHHRNDLMENFFIRLFRGSGLRGLSSFANNQTNAFKGITLIRPLLNFKKEDLVYISNKVFSFYVNDSSNKSEKFKRIRIRNFLKEFKNEGFDYKKFALTINNLKGSNDTIQFYVDKNIELNTTSLKKNKAVLISNEFFNQPNEVVFRSFSSIIKSVSRKYYETRGRKVSNFLDSINCSEKSLKATIGGCIVEKLGQSVLIYRENTYKN